MILMDTNIVSFLFKKDSRTQAYQPHLDNQDWAISLMTGAELFQWAGMRGWGQPRVARLETWIGENFFVLSFDWQTCRLWGEIATECRAKGQPISAQDAWIAATAQQHNLPLVTHNPADFAAVSDLKIITTLS